MNYRGSWRCSNKMFNKWRWIILVSVLKIRTIYKIVLIISDQINKSYNEVMKIIIKHYFKGVINVTQN
jgi:hypothetical protein